MLRDTRLELGKRPAGFPSVREVHIHLLQVDCCHVLSLIVSVQVVDGLRICTLDAFQPLEAQRLLLG
jgi:hypothetical protein